MNSTQTVVGGYKAEYTGLVMHSEGLERNRYFEFVLVEGPQAGTKKLTRIAPEGQ